MLGKKKEQIKHSAHISTEAKLVKLSDKLYNLKDLIRSPPPGWDVLRIQGYFVWAAEVIANLRGNNAYLESELDKVFSSQFEYPPDKKMYPTIPDGDKNITIQKYYDSLKDKI